MRYTNRRILYLSLNALNETSFKSDDEITILDNYKIIGYVKYQFELENENGFYTPFVILSENQNNDRYTDPVQLFRCERGFTLYKLFIVC